MNFIIYVIINDKINKYLCNNKFFNKTSLNFSLSTVLHDPFSPLFNNINIKYLYNNNNKTIERNLSPQFSPSHTHNLFLLFLNDNKNNRNK